MTKVKVLKRINNLALYRVKECNELESGEEINKTFDADLAVAISTFYGVDYIDNLSYQEHQNLLDSIVGEYLQLFDLTPCEWIPSVMVLDKQNKK